MSIITRFKAALFYISTISFSVQEAIQEIELLERPRNVLIEFKHECAYVKHQKAITPLFIPMAKYYLMSTFELPKINDVIKKSELPMMPKSKGKR